MLHFLLGTLSSCLSGRKGVFGYLLHIDHTDYFQIADYSKFFFSSHLSWLECVSSVCEFVWVCELWVFFKFVFWDRQPKNLPIGSLGSSSSLHLVGHAGHPVMFAKVCLGWKQMHAVSFSDTKSHFARFVLDFPNPDLRRFPDKPAEVTSFSQVCLYADVWIRGVTSTELDA